MFSLGPMEQHILGSKLVLCMCPVGFSRIIGVQRNMNKAHAVIPKIQNAKYNILP